MTEARNFTALDRSEFATDTPTFYRISCLRIECESICSTEFVLRTPMIPSYKTTNNIRLRTRASTCRMSTLGWPFVPVCQGPKRLLVCIELIWGRGYTMSLIKRPILVLGSLVGNDRVIRVRLQPTIPRRLEGEANSCSASSPSVHVLACRGKTAKNSTAYGKPSQPSCLASHNTAAVGMSDL